MRVAVIGCGSIGRRHIGNLLALGCGVLAMDPNADAVASATEGAKRFWMGPQHGWTPEDFDALVIAAPWDKHLDYVEAAVDCRKPFFVEKPLGSLDQLHRWREIAAMNLPVNQVGYQLRFQEKAKALKTLAPNPRVVDLVCWVDMSTWPGRSYGPFLLEASHEIDLAMWFGARCNRVEYLNGGHEYVLGDTDSMVKRVSLSNRPGYSRTWRVGSVGNAPSVHFRSPAELGDQMYHDEVAHFLARVRGERDLGDACDLPQALRVLEVCAQVEQMAEGQA